MSTHDPVNRSTETWTFPPPVRMQTVVAVLMVMLVLSLTIRNVEMDRMVSLTGEAVLSVITGEGESQVARGLGTIVASLFPIQIENRTEVSRLNGFDRNDLPFLSHIEIVSVSSSKLDPQTLEVTDETEDVEYLVEPLGYVLTVTVKLLETLEIAVWGTFLAVLISIPLGYCGAGNLAPHPVFRLGARAVVSFLRAVPELVSALFLVLAYGFGPIAGVLALAFHSAGFLGKFFAEDIENANRKPQEALLAMGANKAKVLKLAILPEVWPQYIAYMFYILDRNARMATVIGIVGAGGIGQELKGRFDLFQYQHVGTILVAIFVMVLVIDQVSSRLRSRFL